MSIKSDTYYIIPLKLANYDPTLNAIGIDLGTTECCAAVIRKNGPDFVALDPITKLRTMPSYVAFDETEPKCGQIVVDRMRFKAEYSIFDIKRIIGRNTEEITTDSLWPFKVLPGRNKVWIETETVNGRDIKSPEEVTAALLNHIRITNEEYQDKNVNEVVISIPSEFSEAQKEATKTAAEYAGIEIIHFIPEPIAAAFAYFTEIDIPNNSNILICDCGGGTVDICVAKVFDEQLTVLSYNGDSYLGGRDFDKLLFNHFDAILKHTYKIDVTKTTRKYVLKQKCQDIKHKLSAANDDMLDINDFDASAEGVITVTREEFEAMSTNLIHKIKSVIHRAIVKAQIQKNEINYVFQVGGGCKMPMIKKLLSDIFPYANHQSSIYPDWVVAHGAALYAYYKKLQQREKGFNDCDKIYGYSTLDDTITTNLPDINYKNERDILDITVGDIQYTPESSKPSENVRNDRNKTLCNDSVSYPKTQNTVIRNSTTFKTNKESDPFKRQSFTPSNNDMKFVSISEKSPPVNRKFESAKDCQSSHIPPPAIPYSSSLIDNNPNKYDSVSVVRNVRSYRKFLDEHNKRKPEENYKKKPPQVVSGVSRYVSKQAALNKEEKTVNRRSTFAGEDIRRQLNDIPKQNNAFACQYRSQKPVFNASINPKQTVNQNFGSAVKNEDNDDYEVNIRQLRNVFEDNSRKTEYRQI